MRRRQFKKFWPGDPTTNITAGLMNGVVDSQEQLDRLTIRTGGGPFKNILQPEILYIRNDSGSTRAQYDVLGVTGIAISAATNELEFIARNIILTGEQATSGNKDVWVLLLEACGNGGIAKCALGGTFPCKVNIQSVSDEYAAVDTAGSYNLKSGTSGPAQIVLTPEATGLQWCLIRFPFGAAAAAVGPSQRGILRTDLAFGGCCVVEEGQWISGTYQRNGKTYRAFDAHSEWQGIADITGCDWVIRPDTPTGAELDALGKTVPGSVTITESVIVELSRVTCMGFNGDPLATLPE